MSQMLAFILPMPVAIALVFALVLLLVFSVVALSLLEPAPVRAPAQTESRDP
ncbi:hypothetical protein LQ564_07940 [Massilia sp. G4R7]|uniref:Uncharacterized protein n=1 Tax=Massilia phyllostachyos TaxID=2898585 RepID=A0ABS8Q3C2_9BURK|nr:hypothetical protein [Massilia phyllostachyos]MCD2516246.1 hypothetical protein [Massilia phyllostachyos]